MSNTKHLTQYHPDILERAAGTLSRLLGAEKRVRKGKDKDGMQYEDVPDSTTQLAAAKAVLEIEFPKSIKHQHQHSNTPELPDGVVTDEDLDKMALENPALLARIAADYVDALPQVSEIHPETTTK